MERDDFTIQTSVFEGPLSLLLELVQKRKIFINDIALADIAEEFIRALHSKDEGKQLQEEASFVQVAATLLLLKSKSLLPNFITTDEEEESALELARRLEMFEKVRIYASGLEEMYGRQVLYTKAPEKRGEQEPIFTSEERFSGELFLQRIKNVRDLLPAKKLPDRVSVKQTVRLEDVLEDLTLRIKKYVALSFREFARVGEASKSDVVVHFIALLELVKQGFLEASQSERNGDIQLSRKEISVPNYS